MLIAGIITEYNPFHNGHLYQLEVIRRTLEPDLIVCAMSGDFVQRGEPAIVSKWDRTRMALKAGVDLVVELPYIFAVGRADIFAGGAVSTLEELGVSHLVFSSENGQIAPFLKTIDLIENHRSAYDQTLIEALQQGLSYPNAHAAAYRHISEHADGSLVDLTRPNNSLGFHYIQAIRRHKSAMTPITLQRTEAEHDDPSFRSDALIASGTSIRNRLLGPEELSGLENKLPGYVYSLLKKRKESNFLADWEAFFPFLKYRLLSTDANRLAQIYEAEEGIEHRLLSHIRTAENFHAFLSAVKTKRYTWSRLQRLSVHILTNMQKDKVRQPAESGKAVYLRPLGMNLKGQAYLAQIRKQLRVPLIGKIRKHHPPVLDSDIRAGQLYDFLSGRQTAFTSETAHSPIRYDEQSGHFVR